tara:strand:+ start:731 stop:2161 length:1431 start_codon:yes stop_codon:yes gene_type:complete
MGYEEYKIGNLFLAILFGLPGFFIIHILSKFCFIKSRSFSGFTLQLLSAVVISTSILFLYTPLIDAIEFITGIDCNVTRISPDFRKQILKAIFVKPSENVENIIPLLLINLNIFAITFGSLLAMSINIIRGLAFKEMTFILPVIIQAEYWLRTLTIPLRKLQNYTQNNFARDVLNKVFDIKCMNKPIAAIRIALSFLNKLILSPLYKLSVIILVATLLLFIFLILIAIFIINFASERLSILIHYFLRLFQHPAESLFESLEFKKRKNIPIVEILGANNILSKGKYLSFQPKNAEDISSITITNIIQYSKKEGINFFQRGHREVYEFPDFTSKMTIPMDQIQDFNVRYLRSNDNNWELNIVDLESVDNQLWYLRIFLVENKYNFSLKNFNAYINWVYSIEFFSQLLQLLEETYPNKTQKYHLSRLFSEYRKYLNYYRIRTKIEIDDLDNEEEKIRIRKSRKLLAIQMRQMKLQLKGY